MLFRPFVVAGIILVAFGIICIWIGSSIILLQEEGEGFKIIGLRFLIGGMISIAIGFVERYYLLLKYIINQARNRVKPPKNNSFDWYKR
ncbi:MAG TPA: hypothetical protein VH415_07555 [Nitrososphaeraceae archaeon]|jgi:hypothetical protein